VHTYAQTNVQLYNQLRAEGYSKKDRAFVSDAYQFAMRIFAGIYLPSGKPFLDHLVGTASILARLRVPVEVVAAGLLHAAYLHGDFGSVRGVTKAKREQLKRVVGDGVEEYVARYDRLLLTREQISTLDDTLEKPGPVDRYVVLMRLANELEHHLDLGGLYHAHAEQEQREHQRHLQPRGSRLVSLAHKLGFSSLAAEMEKAFQDVAAAEIPLEPRIRCTHGRAYPIVARSYRERFSVVCRRKLMDARLLVSSRIARVRT
jgi:(p)ppGpp synthase/HD superfamily hydrolase